RSRTESVSRKVRRPPCRRSAPNNCSRDAHHGAACVAPAPRAASIQRARRTPRGSSPQLGIVGIRVAMDARIVLWIVTAREHARRRIVAIDALVWAFEVLVVVVIVVRGAAGSDDRSPALLGHVGHEIVTRDVSDVVRVLAT